MSTKVVIVAKSGDLKEVSVKTFDITTLYKKCNFRKSDGFELRHKFENIKCNGEKFTIHVYSRNNGKSGTENKYDMPPPIDTDLYFGNFALVRYCQDEEKYIDLTVDEWKKVYNKLFKGFEDLSATAEDDANESDELDNISPSMKTKSGYLKDGFVVDSNEDDEVDNESDDDDDDDDDDGEDDDNEIVINEYDDDDDDDYESESIISDEDDDVSGSELEAEEYVYSDEEA